MDLTYIETGGIPIGIYKILNLETELFPITRSCENDDHIESHCGKCWWCQERIWAFGRLGD
jgi:7-cyano-7-deazaguanine synthase in queuosine biosynthesis